MRQAITLLRVSSAGQTRRAGSDEGYSIELQRRGCHDKAKSVEAEVVREFLAPAESASKGLYPSLKELLAFVRERGDIDYLIVYKLDRFARDELTHFSALGELRAAGCRLISVTENVDDTPEGMMLNGMLATMNAFFSRDLARKILGGNIQKARGGGTPKRAPLGYLNVRRWEGANDIRSIEVDPERAPLIKWAFTAYSTGEYTLNELVEELWERGLRSRPTSKRPAAKVPRSTIARLLQDPYYIGVVHYRGVDYQGTHPVFIDPGAFQQVQQVLDSHRTSGEKHWRHVNHLKGTVYCGYCGGRLRFTQVKGRRGGLYRYFVCGTRHSGSTCEQAYLNEHRVEEAVGRYYARVVRFDADRISQLQERLLEAFDRVLTYRDQQLAVERKRLAELDTERRRLLDAHLADAVPLDLFSEKQREIGVKLAAIQNKLSAAEHSYESAQRGLRLACRLLSRAGEAYSEADSVTQRAWNQAFFKRLYVRPSEDGEPEVVRAELTEPFVQLLSEDLIAGLKKMHNQRSTLLAGGSNVDQIVETAGIEPASAVAQRVASTSVSGALISSPTRHAGGVVGDQLRKDVPGSAGASLTG
jgi:site-specific DNA recombinase